MSADLRPLLELSLENRALKSRVNSQTLNRDNPQILSREPVLELLWNKRFS
jgi:hypothetical protein